MALDIQTLIVVLGITHVLQFVVLIHQYVVNRPLRGVGWWLLWSAVEVVAFTCMLLRGVPAVRAGAILAQNSLLILGVMFFYIGIVRFYGRKENRRLLLVLYAAYLTGLGYFLFVQDEFNTRGVIISAMLATLALLSAQALLVNKTRPTAASANLLAGVCLVHGAYFLTRMVVQLAAPPPPDFFAQTWFNGLALMDAIIVGLLWTFGTILMINQRLNAEMKEAKEEMELVFNTSPDAAVISRLSDGLIVYVNDGFVALTGLTREECVGKTTLAVHAWKNPADREAVVRELQEKGSCKSHEAVFQRKDGGEFFGLVSAAVFNLQDVPHVISVTRDITARKQTEAERDRLIQELRQALANVKSLSGLLPICASCKKIRDDQGYWNQVESYVQAHSEATFTHGICPDCMKRLYPEFSGHDAEGEATSYEHT